MSINYPLFHHLSKSHDLTLTESELFDVLQAANRCGWFQIKSPDDLSCGDWYFYCHKSDNNNIYFGEYGDNEISSNQELLQFGDDFQYSDYWFVEFVPPIFDADTLDT